MGRGKLQNERNVVGGEITEKQKEGKETKKIQKMGPKEMVVGTGGGSRENKEIKKKTGKSPPKEEPAFEEYSVADRACRKGPGKKGAKRAKPKKK